MHAGRDMRKLAVDVLAPSSGQQEALARQFARLSALPMFVQDDDDEAGVESFAWTTPAWTFLRRDEVPAQRERNGAAALARMRSAGRVTGLLSQLLDLGLLRDAEQLVTAEFRRFLIFVDATNTELLLSGAIDPGRYPALGLLRSQLHIRRHGPSPRTRHDAEAASAVLRARPGATVPAELSRSCLLAFAAVAAGERRLAVRSLHHIAEMIEASPETLERDTPRRTRTIGNLYLAYWAALQLDRHRAALALATVMFDLSEPSDQLYSMEIVSLITAQDLVGLRSLSSAGDPPPPTPASHAASLVLLEDGEDAASLGYLRPIIERRGAQPSRSGIDALTLMVRALVEAPRLRVADVNEAVERSSSHWQDREPSSFVACAAMVAYAALGARDEARELIRSVPPSDDVFHALARAFWFQWEGRFPEAVEICERFADHPAPRLSVLARTLVAASRVALDQEHLARAELESLWRTSPAPRLLRFALRFVPETVAQQMVQLGDRLPAQLRLALADAADDARPLRWHARPQLTPSEREVLLLMRRGGTNKDIAAARFVTPGTLRSQIKTLYRKLDVSTREEALARAAELDLL